MRLKVVHSRSPRHTESVCAVGWANSDEMVSCSDDHNLLRWNLIDMEATSVANIPNTLFPTSMHWFPRSVSKNTSYETFAMSSSDGKLHIMSRLGKVEKSVDAHNGAAISTRWSPDGTGLLTCGEDGTVKMWSRNGMLRSVLVQSSVPVHCIAWNDSSSKVLYSSGDCCFIKSLKMQMTPIKWKAHDGLVLCCDWSLAADLIITGGEDCKFKVWDFFGRILYNSSPHDFPITSVAWSPDGELFAVGSYNILRLCDKAGWSHSMEKLSTGSILAISWSPDGTQLVGGCATGHVIHAHLIEKRVTYRNLEVIQTKQNNIEVRDVSSDIAKERLETRDRVTRISIGYEYLVIITIGYIYIFSSKNWNTPAIVDLKERSVSMVLQSDKIFLIADNDVLLVYSYEGKSLCELKVPGSGLGRISEKTVSLAKDTVAVRDRGDYNIIHLFDPITSKVQGDGKILHDQEISELAVCQCGPIGDRMAAFRDKSGNVFLAMVKTYGVMQRIAKIGSLVEQLKFNDETNMLAGVADGRLVVWPVPSIVFIDRSLLQQAVVEKVIGNLGKFPLLLNFTENTLVLRRSDGSLIPTMISPFPAALLQYSGQSKWDQAIRMCRQMKDDILWAMLAGLATQAKNLYAAEIAYGALEEGEKVSFLFQARSHQNRDVRNAMLILFGGKVSEATAVLERGGHIFRAIMLNITMFRWSRALELAVKHKTHIETVIGYRQKYLDQLEKKETDAKFLKHMGEVEIDWDHIRETIAEEKNKEKT